MPELKLSLLLGRFSVEYLSEGSFRLNSTKYSKHIMMKNILTWAVFMLMGITVSAQASAPAPGNTEDAAVRTATDQLVAKYALNADQAKQMYTIQIRKQRNLKAIEAIKASAPQTYYGKLDGIQKSTSSSIRRILQTKEQVKIYKDTQSKIRQQRGELTKTMVQQGKSREEINNAVLGIYED